MTFTLLVTTSIAVRTVPRLRSRAHCSSFTFVAFFHTRVVAKLTRQTGEAVRKPTFRLVLTYITCHTLRSIGIALASRIAFPARFRRVLGAVCPSYRTVETEGSPCVADLPCGAWVAVRLFVVFNFRVTFVRVELPRGAVGADIVSVCVFFSVFTCRTNCTVSCGLLGRILSGYTGLTILQRCMQRVIFAVVCQVAACWTGITEGPGNIAGILEISASAHSTV